MAAPLDRIPPPPFWRTRYFEHEVLQRPDRRNIDFGDIMRALTADGIRREQPDGRSRRWVWVERRQKWLRVIVEPDGETVHNAFWDRRFKP